MATQKNYRQVSREAIRTLEIPAFPGDHRGFARLIDLTGTVSDAMDNLGSPARFLRRCWRRLCGQAHRRAGGDGAQRRAAAISVPQCNEGVNRMGETEAYNLAEPGDVVVIEGLAGVIEHGRAVGNHRPSSEVCRSRDRRLLPRSGRLPRTGFPIWARGVTQITGKCGSKPLRSTAGCTLPVFCRRR